MIKSGFFFLWWDIHNVPPGLQNICTPPPRPPTEGIRISWGGGRGCCKTKNLKKCTKPTWNFQRGEGGGSFHGEGMDISVMIQCIAP